MRYLVLLFPACLCCFACAPAGETEEDSPPRVEQWTTHEIVLTADSAHANPYTEVDVWAIFHNRRGQSLIRPAFWDGGRIWKIRFAPPDTASVWTWQSFASPWWDKGLNGRGGTLKSVAYQGDNELLRHGLLRMSEGRRNVVHHDGRPFLLVGDTPWALPFRATIEQATVYARDRRAKGFNAALLMTIQPDQHARGPNARNTPQGFARGFADLSRGHLNQIIPPYFQYFDSLVNVLIRHEIVPVYQPVFHGFGWKGKAVLGNVVNAGEYVRYCKYLLARYGSMPAFWLLAADNGGDDPGVRESGRMMDAWDAYQQPTGIHYNPCDDYIAEWAVNDPFKDCMHFNRMHQEETWLDFQWAQTGHGGEHLYHKVERMYDNQPVKAAANGEPTYEGMDNGRNGLGWWQGEEAWMQLMSGGTMGVVYGAAGLWQWKVRSGESGWDAWAGQPLSWREALDLEGSTYVGLVGKAFDGMPFADMERRPDLTAEGQPLLAVPGRFYIAYLNQGGSLAIDDLPRRLPYRWFNPKTGEVREEGETARSTTFEAPDAEPWVLIVGEGWR